MEQGQPEQEQEQQALLDPNLNAEAYRNLALSDHPPIHDKQLEVVVVYKDDSLLLGASNMVDRYWYGTLWYFDQPANFDHNNYAAATRTESGVRDALFLRKHDKFITGEDSGLLQVYEVREEMDGKKKLQFNGSSSQFDNSVTSMAAFHGSTYIVSGAMNCSLKIWDPEGMLLTLSYHQAQTKAITGVAVQPESNSVFASTSLDSEALVWDTRDPKPATSLWEKRDCGLTAVAWKIDDPNIVAIGGEDGTIAILDTRNIGSDPVYESIQFPRAVRRLHFNPDKSNQLAGCCDSTEVKVFDVDNDKVKVIFENSAHTDFVRGLAWHKNDLITCSWDNTVLRHSVMSQSVDQVPKS